MSRGERGLWLLAGASVLHVVEEAALDWRGSREPGELDELDAVPSRRPGRGGHFRR